MDFNDIDCIKGQGFLGFKTIKKLWNDKSCIPKIQGVYLVLNQTGNSEFINPGVGGFFKDRNPNVSISELTNKFVPSSLVVYIGKAGGPTSNATLYSRLGQYLKFGHGKKVGHWGGRLIWQLKSHMDLTICWKSTPDNDPREIEKSLIEEYVLRFGKKPFANLAK